MISAVLENKYFSLKELLSTSAGAWQRKNGAAQKETQTTSVMLYHETVNETESLLVSGWIKNTNFKRAFKAANPVDPENQPSNTLRHTFFPALNKTIV